MAKEVTVQIRMDSDLKERVEALYIGMGMTFSEAVRIFATQSLLEEGMPFTPRAYPKKGTAYGMLAEYGNAELRKRENDWQKVT